MSRLFISILGNGSLNRETGKFEYSPCEYLFEDEKQPKTRYVQEAAIRHFCKGWDSSAGDHVKILCTEQSSVNQWCNGQDELLLSCLEKLRSQPEYEKICFGSAEVKMPCGKNKDELWEIFEKLLECVDEGDEVYIDVTHGFRSLPMLMLVAVPYLRLLKKVDVKAITYGAFEAKNADGSVPVFDLTDFITLMDWTNAARNFVNYGRFDDCRKLLDRANKDILRETRGQDAEASLCREISKSVDDFTRKIEQNRLESGIVRGVGNKIFDNLQSLKDFDMRVPAFKPLIDVVSQKLEGFNENDNGNVFKAVDWCIEHRFLQNGYSILLEGCINIAMDRLVKLGIFAAADKKDSVKRQVVINTSKYWVEKVGEGDSNKLEELNRSIPFRESIFNNNMEYAKSFETLNKTRNAFMHCGTGKNELPTGLDELEKRLCKLNENLKQWYKEIGE